MFGEIIVSHREDEVVLGRNSKNVLCNEMDLFSGMNTLKKAITDSFAHFKWTQLAAVIFSQMSLPI